ncbi:MAG TPA: hypothetical protein VFJ16_31435 [Longimicrobium sp.]|nr:hypothetical protein [Longimicrobium sp.]
MTSIPPFDKHGNLPVGDLFQSGAQRLTLLDVTLQDVHDRFVAQFPKSNTRPGIWDGWMRHRQDLDAFGIPYATMVNGSFVTMKEDPGDVDICLVMEADSINQLEASDRGQFEALRKLTDTSYTKLLYLCDTYLLRLYPMSSPRFPLVPRGFTYWARVFGTDRRNRPKNFLLVTQRGVV